jgi:hypothetical protein
MLTRLPSTEESPLSCLRSTVIVCASFVLGLAVLPAPAQELRGTVRGTVTDNTSGIIPGAKVTLRNVGTSVETTQVTNSAGQYVFDFVSPGTYTVTVAMEGFRSFVQENVLVQTRADVTVDARMEVGAVTESIKVTESPVAVQFNRATMETTLDTKMSNSLPIIHRNPFLLLTIDPQVTYTGGGEQSPYHHWAASYVDVGGGTRLKNDVLVDGSPNTWGPKTNYVPAMDAVSELNVQQNPTDAEYGHSAGGIISLQMKSGTNDWHGTAYYFGRNPKLNALADRISRSPNIIRHNVWGATSQNPIVKNKVFNFISYEGQNLREPVNQFVTVPTDLERQGNFSQTFAPSGAVKTIYDPMTTVFDRANNRATRQPFAGNIIPAARIDPVAARFLQDIWAPNGPGDDITRVNNYKNTFPRVYEYYNLTDRVDWIINDSWKVFGRFSRLHTNVLSPNPSGTPAGATGGSERNSLTAAGDVVWNVNPTTVFNFRGSYNKPVDRFIDPVAEVENYNEFWPNNNWYDEYAKTLPAIYYPGIILVGGSTFGRASWWYSAPDFWNLQSKVSMQMGRHYVKAGGEFRRYRGNSGFFQPTEFRFNPALTADTFINPDTLQRGSAYATMLLGALSDDTRIRTSPLYGIRNNFYGAYIQDDFKINQKWTLNFGVRYEFDSDIVDNQDRLTRALDLNSPIPEFQGAGAPVLPPQVTAIRNSAPAWNGEWIFTDSNNRGGYRSPRFTLLPRFGLAYRLNDRTSLRFGYARYVIPPSVHDTGGLNLNDTVPYPGYENESFPLPALEGVPQAFMRDPFPSGGNPLNPVPAKTYGRYTNLGSTANSPIFFEDLKNAYNDRFNFSYQTQIWSQIIVDATYFVSIGTNHYTTLNINQVDPRYGFEHRTAVNQSVPNPFYNILPRDKFPGALRNQQQVTVGSLLRPYPQYGDITVWHYPGVHRRYQSLQLKAQRPFVNGFNFLIGYNYHRAGNDEFYDAVDQVDQNMTFQDSPDRRHKFNLTGIYELPIGRSKRLLGTAPSIVDAVVGGWSLSGIYQYISGAYLRFGGLQYAGGDPRVEDPTRNRWFDTSQFSLLPAFTRRTNPLQFSGLTGPRISTVDATMSKNFKITERIGLELRIEAYNLANVMVQGDPNLNVQSSLFGRINSQRGAYFGRQLQYNARIRW